ncbi:MAG: S8 family serine peptidase [Planctomycetota bacterium]
MNWDSGRKGRMWVLALLVTLGAGTSVVWSVNGTETMGFGRVVASADNPALLEIVPPEVTGGAPPAAASTVPPETEVEAVPVEPKRVSVLVYLEPAKAGDEARAAANRAAVRDFARVAEGYVRYEYTILPSVLNLRDIPVSALKDLENLPGVQRVEEDTYDIRINLHDSTPLVRGLQSQITGAGLSADGSGIRICIVDTGIDTDHIMYASRIDLAASYDFYNDDTNPEDDNGHGSHVAGIAAGGTGLQVDFGCVGPEPFQGIAPAATLVSAKVLNSAGGGYDSDIIAGIDHCANQSPSGGRADVINLSIGTGQYTGPCTHSWAVAANNAVNNGVVVVAASGNNNYSNAMTSPACGANVISVGATYDENFPNCEDSTSTFYWSNCTDVQPDVNQVVCFSNESDYLDVTAPGAVIYSASTAAGGSSITAKSGTSMASPHVAGLAALILDMDPTLTPAEVRQLIRDGSIDMGPAGRDRGYGFGRIDVIDTLQLVGPGCTGDPDCNDGLYCNGVETCVGSTCQAGTPPNCSDGVSCTVDSCNETTDSCDHMPDNGLCNNGVYCDGAEICNAVSGCQAGTPINCDDSIACTADSCNESTDSCNHTPSHAMCDDGVFCNGAETCNPASGCVAGGDPCPGQTCDEVNDVCVGGAVAWMSFKTTTTVPGVGSVQNEDIVAYDQGTGTWSLIFDGSDVGLSSFEIDGMAVLASGDILLSFTAAGNVTGLVGGPSGTSVDDSDIIRFTPTSLGATTAGTFYFYFDGSDVGLTANDEDIDAIALTSDGRLIVSALGNFSGTGANGVDEDLFQFNATSLGATTSGSFQMYFDGSDVGLTGSAEDVDGAGLTPDGTILLSTEGAFSVPGVSGADEDIVEFTPTLLGSTTAGTYTMFLDLSALGIATSENIGSLELR